MSWMVKGFAGIQAGNAQKALGKQEMIAAEDEARQLEQQGDAEVAAGSFNATRVKQKAEEYLSAMRAKAAAGGQSSSDPSVLAVQAKSIKEASIEELMIMAAAEDRKKTLRREARQTRAQGKLNKYGRNVQAWNSYAGAAATVIDGAKEQWFGGSGD